MLRIAINGFGRIGRCVFRALYESELQHDLQVVAINEPANAETIVHLLKYDSTHGRFSETIALEGETLRVNDCDISLSHAEDLRRLPWQQHNIDLVIESSGAVSTRRMAEQHLQQGAEKVLFSQPADTEVDITVVYGYNQQNLLPGHKIISNASCTTNCIVPIIDVLDRTLQIESGTITTIHSAMNDQPVIDAYHHTDLRKTRAAMQSIIPVDTELAKGIERLMPAMKDKFSAQALRVPTVNVSAMDLTVQVREAVTVETVNGLLKEATQNEYQNIIGFTMEPLASCDFNHDSRSAIVDGSQTRVSNKHLVKVLVWFDNEWGYACRMLDVLNYIDKA